ncbi:hypothetical protein RN001_007454 [Aquatica leii]|uniref:Peptidase S1 domain-containing protein n=1 Tax=Aquatica leii TaxID=1421715 RepID=A0AAN7P9J4_9COLE|nr:hypothetical protein RN001_007454 [Aquatica leii]
MSCLPQEFFKVVCADKRTGIFMTLIFALVLSLMGLSVYLVVRPIECIEQKRYIYVNKMYETRQALCQKRINCREIPIVRFPQAVAIVEKGTNLHVCSGVIISDQWILTAARCAAFCNSNECSNYRIRAESSYSNRDGKLFNVTKILIHPLFNESTLEHDLALIQTDRNNNVGGISFSNSIPISAELYGWTPFSKADVPYRDNILKIMDFNIIPNDLCNIYLKGEYANIKLRSNMICATLNFQEGGCYIDSGSPLVSDNRLIGIAMFGKLCYSCPSNMAVFTNIHRYEQFIQDSLIRF